MRESNEWIVRLTGESPEARVICLPHAGGSAAIFTPWRKDLDKKIELCAVQYPGRGLRFGEDAITDPHVMIERLGDEVAPLTDMPYVLLGHSLGALLAFELARMLRQRGYPMPRALILSACRPPIRLPSPFIVNAVSLPEEEFLTALRTLGGIPDDLGEEPAFREMLLSVTRKDFDLVSRYRYHAQERLDVPAWLLYGEQDRHVGPDMLGDWGCEFVQKPKIEGFPGGHFYFEEPDATKVILSKLQAHLAPQPFVARI